MTNGELTQQTQEDHNGGRHAVISADGRAGFAVWITDVDVGPPTSVTLDGVVPEGEPLLEGVFHLLVADEDVAHRVHMSLATLCGAWVQPPQLPPSSVGHWRARSPRYCLECVREALQGAAAGDTASARR